MEKIVVIKTGEMSLDSIVKLEKAGSIVVECDNPHDVVIHYFPASDQKLLALVLKAATDGMANSFSGSSDFVKNLSIAIQDEYLHSK